MLLGWDTSGIAVSVFDPEFAGQHREDPARKSSPVTLTSILTILISHLLSAVQTARMGRTGGGNGSPPAAPSTPPARGNGGGGAFAQQQQQQQQQHAVSGRAKHAMIALPIALATFALVLQVRIQTAMSTGTGGIALHKERTDILSHVLL